MSDISWTKIMACDFLNSPVSVSIEIKFTGILIHVFFFVLLVVTLVTAALATTKGDLFICVWY